MADEFGRIELLPDDGLSTDIEEPLDLGISFDEEGLGPTADVEAQPYGRTYLIDFGKRTLLRYGQRAAETEGVGALRAWIEKTVHTAQLTYPIYSDDYGIKDPTALIGLPPESERNQSFRLAIIDALMVHDRITDVTDFDYVTHGDGELVEIIWTVVTDESDELPIGVTFGA